MNGRLVFILFVCLAVSGYFLTTTAAPTSPERPNHVKPDTQVQPDIPTLVADVVAQALAAEGYEVHRDGRLVMVVTDLGELAFELPATDEALRRGEVIVSLDGMVLMPGDADFLPGGGAEAAGGFDLIECIFASLDIYGLKLDICEFGPPDFLCAAGATFDLVLNVLRCIGDPF